MRQRTLVARISEYGNDSLSLVIFPPHFEVKTNFEDDRFETGDFSRSAKNLCFIVEFNDPEMHDTGEDTILRIPFFLEPQVPVELYGEFIIESSGINIMEFMQDRITSDIADYIADSSLSQDSYLDLDGLYETWSGLVDNLVMKEVEKLQNRRKEKNKNKD